ncbi:hypothetical protein PIB30_079967, partial [Stylosanthes scabra]|nr:hypothetical protein [Stylosanthes scabra]
WPKECHYCFHCSTIECESRSLNWQPSHFLLRSQVSKWALLAIEKYQDALSEQISENRIHQRLKCGRSIGKPLGGSFHQIT